MFLWWLIHQYAQTVVCFFHCQITVIAFLNREKKLLMVECSWLISNFSVKSSISTFRSVNLIIFFLALNTSKLFVFSWFCCIYDFTEHSKFLTTMMCSHVRLTIITSNKCDYSWIELGWVLQHWTQNISNTSVYCNLLCGTTVMTSFQ